MFVKQMIYGGSEQCFECNILTFDCEKKRSLIFVKETKSDGDGQGRGRLEEGKKGKNKPCKKK